MHPRTWRITSWWGKLLYVVAWPVAVQLLGWLFGLLGVPTVASSIIVVIYDLAVLLVGARIFRGKGEPVAPPRPWWQMTARRTLSRRLGIWLAIGAGLAAAVLLFSLFRPSRGLAELDIVLEIFYFGVPAYLYLNSAARLKPEPKPDQFPTVVHL